MQRKGICPTDPEEFLREDKNRQDKKALQSELHKKGFAVANSFSEKNNDNKKLRSEKIKEVGFACKKLFNELVTWEAVLEHEKQEFIELRQRFRDYSTHTIYQITAWENSPSFIQGTEERIKLCKQCIRENYYQNDYAGFTRLMAIARFRAREKND